MLFGLALRKEQMIINMKKTLLTILLLSFALTACGTEKKTGVPEESEKPFEEVQKVDIEISDYVEPTPTPELTQPSAETSPVQTAENTDTKAEEPSSSSAGKSENTNSDNNKSNGEGVKNDEPQQQNTQADNGQSEVVRLDGKIICIDPGHGIFTENRKEKIAPNSNASKDAFKEGTKGASHIEDDAVLAVGLKLKAKLEELGATVIMTRSDAYTNMSNIERAQYANNNNADISIKLHADSTQEGGSGMTMLVPGYKYITDKQMLSDSKRLGKAIIKNAASLTGARNRGTYTNTEMTGFNWSTVPVVLFEMGFMTNSKDEAKLFDEEYQGLIADGIVKGILEYYK